MVSEHRRDDEIDLSDYIHVITKRKKIIVGIVISTLIIQSIFLLLKPKQFEITQVLVPPMIGAKNALGNTSDIKERIEAGVYDYYIKQELKLPSETPFNFIVTTPQKGNLVKVALAVPKRKIELGIQILQLLLKQLKGEYEPFVQQKKNVIGTEINILGNEIKEIELSEKVIDKEILIKVSKINKRESEILLAKQKKTIIEERIDPLQETIHDARANTDQLLKDRQKMIEDRSKHSDPLISLLYTTHGQQAIAYYNQLLNQLNSFRIDKEQLQMDILTALQNVDIFTAEIDALNFQKAHVLANSINKINIEIKQLELEKDAIRNIQILQRPENSVKLKKTKWLHGLVLGTIISLGVGLCAAFGKEYLDAVYTKKK